MLHRYRSLDRWTEGRQLYELARRIFALVIPISAEILDRARAMLDEYPELMAREALHASVVETEKLEAICSYDDDFDEIRTIRRIEPAR